jgi:NAD+ kinase
MPAVKTVGIFAKPNAPAAIRLVPELLAWLTERGIAVRMDEVAAGYAGTGTGLPRPHVPDSCGLAIVLGGDGTLLSAARALAGRPIPLLAVNLGGLGFLTSIQVGDLFPELERALTGDLHITRRNLLHVRVLRDDMIVAEYDALNDVVIAKSSIARIVDLDVWAGDTFVCEYKADGLIVSTPTGSTAYSLAAGGPIVFPTVRAVCITPICPHTLTNRPLIIPADLPVRVVSHAKARKPPNAEQNDTNDSLTPPVSPQLADPLSANSPEDNEDSFLTVDGQVGGALEPGDTVECTASKSEVLLVQTPDKTFFDVLRQKLKWGER